jgi:hypothetical protein
VAAAPHVNWAARRIPSSRRPFLPGPTASVVARAIDAGSFGLDRTAQNTLHEITATVIRDWRTYWARAC